MEKEMSSGKSSISILKELREFEKASQRRPGPVPFSIQWGESGPILMITCLIHGDEVGCLPAMMEFVRRNLETSWIDSFRLVFVVGNPEAAIENQRYLDQDLNRSFGESIALNRETKRAQELSSFLTEVDVLIDLHQTIEPTQKAFYIFPNTEEAVSLARALSLSTDLLTREPGEAFSRGQAAATEVVRANAGIGITLEVSQKGFSSLATDISLAAIERAVALFRERPLRKGNEEDRKWIQSLAATRPALQMIWRSHTEVLWSPKDSLRPGIKNFESVKVGDLLGKRGDGTDIRSPKEGWIFFPKYPKRQASGAAIDSPTSLYMIFSAR